MNHVENMLDRMPNSRRALKVMVALGLAVLVGIIAWLIYAVRANSDALAHTAAVGRSRGQALGTANAKLTQNGIAPVTPKPEKATPGNTDLGPTTPSSTPSAVAGAQGAKGDQGPGPSSEQVRQAVTAYCDDHGDCQAKPTQAQVAAAVLTYCKGDKCVGPAGEDATGAPGKDGKDGADATGEPGPQGPPPTDQQVAQSVAAFCADGACRGPKGDSVKGDKGDKGDPGSDGRGITSTVCGSDAHWTITYSDGSKADAGICRETVTTTVTAPPTSPAPTSTAP